MLVLLVGVIALGAETSARQAAGVCLVGAGVLLVRGLSRQAERRTVCCSDSPIAAVIAAYTLVDDRGVEHAAPFVYLELSMLLPAVVYTAFLGARAGVGAIARRGAAAVVLAGLMTFGAYRLVLAALQRQRLLPRPVRETSIVIATGLGACSRRARGSPAPARRRDRRSGRRARQPVGSREWM